MATKRSKSPEPIKVRSTVARQAYERRWQIDTSPKRLRTRSAARRWAVADAS